MSSPTGDSSDRRLTRRTFTYDGASGAAQYTLTPTGGGQVYTWTDTGDGAEYASVYVLHTEQSALGVSDAIADPNSFRAASGLSNIDCGGFRRRICGGNCWYYWTHWRYRGRGVMAVTGETLTSP